jgi:hypothetical protein
VSSFSGCYKAIYQLAVVNSCIPIYQKETIGSLAYGIQLDKNQFGLDDEIEVYAKVTNVGKETITYVSGSSSCPKHVVIDIVHQESGCSSRSKLLNYRIPLAQEISSLI